MFPPLAGENRSPTIDWIIEETGGCGLFQVLLIMAVMGLKVPISMSQMLMAFGNYNPGWTCLDPLCDTIMLNGSVVVNFTLGSEDIKSCDSCEVFENCSRIVFNEDVSTIVSEWGLLCNKSWIPSMIISIQMVGLVFGGFIGGHFCDRFGRKYSVYGSIFLNGCLNLITPFSINWQMFTALRFVLGLCVGACTSIIHLYSIEFVGIKWRGVIGALPAWNTGALVFAVCATLLRNWRYLHYLDAFLSFAWFLNVLWVPDSMRWLAARGKIEQASEVANKIARLNRKPVLDEVNGILTLIGQSEQSTDSSNDDKYEILDIFRRGLYIRTIIMSLTWITMIIVFYTIAFGIKAMSGNFFINLIIFSFITTFTYPLAPLVSNKIGRRFSILLFFALTCACCFSVVLVSFSAPEEIRGTSTMVLSMFTICFIDTAWCIVIVYTLELYPTVVRGLAMGFAGSVGRTGGIIAPFLIPDDPGTIYISYIVLGMMTLVCGLLMLLLPETKRKPLADIFNSRKTNSMAAI